MKFKYQYCVEKNVAHHVHAADLLVVEKLIPIVHSCFFSLHELVQPSQTVVYLFLILITTTFIIFIDWTQKATSYLGSYIGWSYSTEKHFIVLLVCNGCQVLQCIYMLQISRHYG